MDIVKKGLNFVFLGAEQGYYFNWSLSNKNYDSNDYTNYVKVPGGALSTGERSEAAGEQSNSVGLRRSTDISALRETR